MTAFSPLEAFSPPLLHEAGSVAWPYYRVWGGVRTATEVMVCERGQKQLGGHSTKTEATSLPPSALNSTGRVGGRSTRVRR